MRRRDLLALSGPLFAGLAGCLAPFDARAGAESATRTADSSTVPESTATTSGRPTTERPTTEPESTTPSAADASVSTRIDALQPGVVTMTTPDSSGIGRDEGQYLLLDVSAERAVVPSPRTSRSGSRERPPSRSR